jgi:death-on-curing protein
MFVWIDSTLALAIHDRQLAEHGGASGLRDENLLESALVRPQQMFTYADSEPDLAELAAALAHGLARNRPFVDGNKRTAMVACETFIELNGGTLYAEDADLFPLILQLANGRLSASEFAAWLRSQLRASRVHEPHEPYLTRKRKPVAVRKTAVRGKK